jgi:hypothetical protein
MNRGGGFDSRNRSDNRSGNRDNRSDNRSDNRDNRSDNRNDRYDDRRDDRNDRYDDRKEFRDDRYDDRREFYDDRWRYAVGASLTVASFRALTCASRTVVVNGISYYGCGPTWYNRAYSGGAVTYVVVTAPPGY